LGNLEERVIRGVAQSESFVRTAGMGGKLK
jgi:hypothetical protein